jgi:hypothetical protein
MQKYNEIGRISKSVIIGYATVEKLGLEERYSLKDLLIGEENPPVFLTKIKRTNGLKSLLSLLIQFRYNPRQPTIYLTIRK